MRKVGPDHVGAMPGQGAASSISRARMPAWRSAAGVYLGVSAMAHLAWEFAQMPFYTVWRSGSPSEIVVDALHCTAGDILIAASTLGLSLLLLRAWGGPLDRLWRVASLTTLLGIAYTVFSEWLNVQVRHTWGYSDLMPVLPRLGAGLLPLLQWLVIPLAAFLAAQHVKGTKR